MKPIKLSSCTVEVYDILKISKQYSKKFKRYAYRIRSRNGRIIGGSTDPQKRKAYVMMVAKEIAKAFKCKVRDLT